MSLYYLHYSHHRSITTHRIVTTIVVHSKRRSSWRLINASVSLTPNCCSEVASLKLSFAKNCCRLSTTWLELVMLVTIHPSIGVSCLYCDFRLSRLGRAALKITVSLELPLLVLVKIRGLEHLHRLRQLKTIVNGSWRAQSITSRGEGLVDVIKSWQLSPLSTNRGISVCCCSFCARLLLMFHQY
jgi:hypothetical protein